MGKFQLKKIWRRVRGKNVFLQACACRVLPAAMLLWLACCHSTGHAQQNLADSIEKLLKGNMPDSERANAMLFRGMYYEPVDTGKAHQAYREARSFAVEKKLNYFISRTYQFESFLYSQQGQDNKAIENITTALQYVKDNPEKKFKLLYIKELTNLAVWYLETGNVEKAVEYQLKSNEMAEQAGTVKVVDYINTANIYHNMEDTASQEKYVFKALALAKKNNSEIEMFQSYIFIALYYTTSKNYAAAKRYSDTARFYHYRTYDQMNAAVGRDLAYNTYQGYYLTVATVFGNVSEDDSALLVYNQAYQLAKDHNVARDLVEPQLQTGYIYLKKKKYPLAEKYLLNALADATAMGNPKAQETAYKNLARLYGETRSFEKAFNYAELYHAAYDSISGIEKKKFTNELEVKYETQKKDAQLQLQNAVIQRERIWKYVLGGSLVALLIIALAVWQAYRNRQRLLMSEKKLQEQKILQLENEKQLAATQAIVKGQEEERSRLAKDLHDGLGGILSSVKYSFSSIKQNFVLSGENAKAFEKSMGMLDASIAELRRVAHNMMPEALMKLSLHEALQDYCQQVTQSSALQVTYQGFGMEGLDLNNTLKTSAYRIIQELINNTVKHAAATTALVQVIVNNGKLEITAEDNGQGFDTATSKEAGGIGYKNLTSRVAFLKGKMDVQSKPGEGTSVYVELPL